MGIRFLGSQDTVPAHRAREIDSHADFVSLIRGLSQGMPVFCEFVHDGGQRLLVGVGGQFGCLQISGADGLPPYWMAVAKSPLTGTRLAFQFGGTQSVVSGRYRVPFDDLVIAAAHFFETGTRSDALDWAEI